MEKNTNKKLLEREWTYDRIVVNLELLLKRSKQEHEKVIGNLDIYQNILENPDHQAKIAQFQCLEAITGEFENKVEDAKLDIEANLQSLAALKKAHPVIIGPGTLDSLLRNEPESYEYLKNGRLPFNITFLEFLEPISLNIPFENVASDILGILFNNIGEFKQVSEDNQSGVNNGFIPTYCTEIFYLDNSIESIGSFSINFNLDCPGYFIGTTYNHNQKGSLFRVDFNKKEVNNLYVKEGERVCDVYSLDELESEGTIHSLGNLCVNLVNYINAHNTTIGKRKRKTNIQIISSKGKKTKVVKRQPFYIVTVKDREILEPEDPIEPGKKLEERIYVRGHDRRLKDKETNEIYKTTWVRPHVRGPKDAPWREQRYQVLYEKLQKEQEMLKSLKIY